MSTRTADLAPIHVRGTDYTDRGHCYESGYDGPVIHTVYCCYRPSDTAVSGSDCIRPGDDGPAIKARRDAAADRLKFTPPAYREHVTQPGPVIVLDRRQPVEVLALRGRPLGTSDWTTWETYVDRGSVDDNWLTQAMRRVTERAKPPAMTPAQAHAIVAEFTDRVPGYEFKVVRARLTVTEEDLT